MEKRSKSALAVLGVIFAHSCFVALGAVLGLIIMLGVFRVIL